MSRGISITTRVRLLRSLVHLDISSSYAVSDRTLVGWSAAPRC
jgi:hypothetical protein